MAAAEVDLAYLSTHAGVPELDLDAVVTAPTVDLVSSVLGAIVTKLRDLEQEKFQLGVELEAAYRGAESRCEQFKATSDKALKEVEEVRQKLQNEGMFALQQLLLNRVRCLTWLPTQRPPVEHLKMSFKLSSPPGQHRFQKSIHSGHASPP
jgi:nucleoprotein TPR